MIGKLKKKFMLLAMTALFVLLAVTIASMNILNYNSIIEEADATLLSLAASRNPVPNAYAGKRPNTLTRPMPEAYRETRYFSVSFNAQGDVVNVNVNNISTVEKEEALQFAQSVRESDKRHGFAEHFRYIISQSNNGIRIVFLDCGVKMDSFKSFLMSSILIAVIGYIVTAVIIGILSGKIVQPIAESYEKQRRFITDAGHEIKTPLTIINANVDILEMELGEGNESLQDIQQQTKRLRSLTNDLVMLSRMQEAESSMIKLDFPISEVVAEAAHPFEKPAISQGKELVCNIEPMLSFCGNDKAIAQLTCLMLDNALKYSPPCGKIILTLAKQNRTLCLSCFNTTQAPVNAEQLKYVFDRFYRTDSSRNSETGGHGIGLSIAKAIVTAHGGKITAWTKDGASFEIAATFSV